MKNELLEQEAERFSALGEPTRLALLLVIADGRGDLNVLGLISRMCDAGYPIKQPSVSHHLRVLRYAGLVSAERHGLEVFYSIRPGRLADLGLFLAKMGEKMLVPARAIA